MVKIYHAELKAEAKVDEQSVPVWLSVGWSTEPAQNEAEQNPAPSADVTPQVQSKSKTTTDTSGS